PPRVGPTHTRVGLHLLRPALHHRQKRFESNQDSNRAALETTFPASACGTRNRHPNRAGSSKWLRSCRPPLQLSPSFVDVLRRDPPRSSRREQFPLDLKR